MEKNNKKVKYSALIATFICLMSLTLNAQNFSTWAVDKAHPTLKARYATLKDAKGYNFIQLEVASTVACRLQVTATLCNADKKDKNGWRNLVIPANKSIKANFKILNSCTNGWWWW